MSGINHKNIILQNGVIDNWNRGVHYYQGSTTDANLPFTIRNVTFTNNVQDIYSAAGTTKDILIEDSYFYNSLYLAALRTAVLRNNHIDLSSQLYIHTITDILFENNPSLKADYMYYYAVTNFNVTSDDPFIYLNNLCGSTFANTGNSILRIKLQGNYNQTGNCVELGSNGDTRKNIIFDFDGYTLRGDGTSNGFYMSGLNTENINIQNGAIENFAYGIHFRTGSTTNANLPFTIENITFSDNGVGFYTSSASSNDVLLKNNIFNGVLTLSALRSAKMYGNTIGSGDDATVSSVTTFNPVWNLDGFDVGNMWGDFACNNSADNYSVSYGGYDYTICNSDDYNHKWRWRYGSDTEDDIKPFA
jgi:hypothetical protein